MESVTQSFHNLGMNYRSIYVDSIVKYLLNRTFMFNQINLINTVNETNRFNSLQGTSEELKLLDEKLKDIGTEKVVGDEEKRIIDKIKEEEESAASGMGMIFG